VRTRRRWVPSLGVRLASPRFADGRPAYGASTDPNDPDLAVLVREMAVQDADFGTWWATEQGRPRRACRAGAAITSLRERPGASRLAVSVAPSRHDRMRLSTGDEFPASIPSTSL